TVGYTQPAEFGGLIRTLLATTPSLREVTVSVHCHDDLGLAVANTLAAVEAGATQVEGCINGIGERAGNAALEEIVMALHTRAPYYGAETGIRTRELYRVSRLVSRLTGMSVQANKAVVGDNAFAHEAGIHQDGVLKARETYEIMNAEMVGREAGVLVLGKHSGRAAFRKALTDLGYSLDEAGVNAVFARFKDLADRKGAVSSEELRALVDTGGTAQSGFALDRLQVVSGTHLTAMATVTVSGPEGPSTDSGTGDGPVDAALNAVARATGVEASLEGYRINALTSGRDAAAEVSVRVRVGDRAYPGTGVATDVVEASVRAWLAAVNAGGSLTPRDDAGVAEALGAV
ncbi:MAG TPA: 2-isopropylmalate synthase, partial [Deinococcales bacterium]|nr:2-isopropylmalate synthase [Deinococcales bacterium]